MRTTKSTPLVIVASVAFLMTCPGSSRSAPFPGSDSGKQLMVARWTDRAPLVDGVMSPGEWSAAIPVHVNFVKPDTAPGVIEMGFIPPVNPDDMSFTVYAVYDAANLYIAVDVADDRLFVGTDPASVWLSDAVEIFIDGDRANGCPPPGDAFLESLMVYEIWQGCTPDSGHQDFYNWDAFYDYLSTGDVSLFRVEGKEGFQLLCDIQGNNYNWYTPQFLSLDWASAPGLRPRGYMVEWRIALSSIDTLDGLAETPAGPGDVIGFNVSVDDNDDGTATDCQGFWEGVPTGHIFDYEDGWGLLYLQPKPAGKIK